MNIKLMNPDALHKKAQEVPKEEKKSIEEVPLWQTVVGFINNSKGVSRAPAPICGVMTLEYIVIPVPASLLDLDALSVKVRLEDAGFYCEIIADALQRFNEESLIVVSWDPAVITAFKSGSGDRTLISRGMCILPGREGTKCNGCYDCHVYYQSHMNN